MKDELNVFRFWNYLYQSMLIGMHFVPVDIERSF